MEDTIRFVQPPPRPDVVAEPTRPSRRPGRIWQGIGIGILFFASWYSQDRIVPVELDDGTTILLRDTRPPDEALFMFLLGLVCIAIGFWIVHRVRKWERANLPLHDR
jgi:hypothetical protein